MNGVVQIIQVENVPTYKPFEVLYRVSFIPTPGVEFHEYIEEIYAFFIYHLEISSWGQILWSTDLGTQGIIGSTSRMTVANFSVDDFWDRLDNVTNSHNEDLSMEDLYFFIVFHTGLPIRGERVTKAQGVLNINGGHQGFCFIYSLLIAFRNDHDALAKFTKWKYNKQIGVKKMLDIITNVDKSIAQDLREYVGEPVFDITFFKHVVLLFPKYQIAVYKNSTKHPCIKERGLNYKYNKDGKYTILLDYHKEVTSVHVNYITHIKKYLKYKEESTHKVCCYDCFKLFPTIAQSMFNVNNIENHECNGTALKCKYCLRVECYSTLDSQKCPHCFNISRNPECLSLHKCSKALWKCKECGEIEKASDCIRHDCEKPFCKTCKRKLPKDHECIHKENHPNFQNDGKNPVGKVEYAYADIESCTKKSEMERLSRIVGNSREFYMGQTDNHVVNYLYMEFDNGDSMEFNTALDFLEWGRNAGYTSKLKIYFHNGGKFDLRLLFDAWIENYNTFPKVCWAGQKILMMHLVDHDDESYNTSVGLYDSMFHISMALSKFSKTFDLPITKGFFPHTFHTVENQYYVGPIPQKDLFPRYKSKELEEFNKWHDTFEGDYNLRSEMIKYCKMDVELLRKGCKIYMKAGEDSQVNPKKGIVCPFDKITIAGYCMKIYQEQHYDSRSIGPMTKDLPYFNLVNESFHGGDTNCTCVFKELSAEDIERGERIFYVDKVSMYPDIMVRRDLPVGTPKYVQHNAYMEETEILKIFGFLRVDYEIIDYLHHPVSMIKNTETNKLCCSLNSMNATSLTSIEIKAMIETRCYKFTKVWDYLEYKDKRDDLFKSYMNDCVGGKTLNSHDPKDGDEQEALDLYEHTNQVIDIRGKPFKSNPGLRAIYKLMCNSLWGKFGERDDRDIVEVVSKNTLDLIVGDIENGDDKVDITSQRIHPLNPELVMVGLKGENKHKYIEEKKKTYTLNNRGIASFITAYGRVTLGDIKRKLMSRSLYNDTDSIIYHYIPGQYEVPLGTLLGEWSSEIPEEGGFIDKYVATGPKSYSYRVLYEPQPARPLTLEESKTYVVKGSKMYKYKYMLKCKGITMTTANQQLVTFDTMKDLVMGKNKSITTSNIKFHWRRMQRTMHTFMEDKLISFTYNKGEINDEYKVLPFGWNKFLYLKDGKYYKKSDHSWVYI